MYIIEGFSCRALLEIVNKNKDGKNKALEHKIF